VVLAAAAPAWADDEVEPTAPASSEGLTRLVEALRSGPTFKVRATAAVALGRMSDNRALPALAESLRVDDSFAVRAASASALGRLGDPAGLPALFDALGDRERYVVDEAREALARFYVKEHLFSFRDALRSENPAVRLVAVSAYGEVMREPSTSAGVAAAVINALGDDDDNVAGSAARAVAALPHERAVPLLVDGVEHAGSSVRMACAALLEKRADKRAVEPLIALVLDTDQNSDVRAAAGKALRQHAEYVDVAAYRTGASEAATDAERIKALRILAVLGDSAAAGAIDAALQSSDAAVRVAGARAAADVGDARARASLSAAVSKESDPRLKRQLELILKSIR
jgi:HEAT repeat protein